MPPFFPTGAVIAAAPTPDNYERRLVGIRAHNRWLVDFCNERPGQRAGLAQIFLNDVDDAVADIHWAKEHGLHSILLPAVAPNSHLAPLYAPEYDPVWRACEETGLPVTAHSGGTGMPNFGKYPIANLVFVLESSFYSNRSLWHLLMSGVFERFPTMKFAMTEQGSAWVPDLLDRLDNLHAQMVRDGRIGELGLEADVILPLKPSDYFRRQVYIGASFPSPSDAAVFHDIGLDHVMWGSDYPHHEACWPYSRESLRRTFAGWNEADLRQVLAGHRGVGLRLRPRPARADRRRGAGRRSARWPLRSPRSPPTPPAPRSTAPDRRPDLGRHAAPAVASVPCCSSTENGGTPRRGPPSSRGTRPPARSSVRRPTPGSTTCRPRSTPPTPRSSRGRRAPRTSGRRTSYQAHQLMLERREALAKLMTEEQGKPIRMARNEVGYAADFLLWFAEEAKRVYGETIPSARADQRFLVLRQPVGVVGAITPWNYPVSMLTRKIAPALAAGCTIVLKPAEQTPLLAVEVFKMLRGDRPSRGRREPRHHRRSRDRRRRAGHATRRCARSPSPARPRSASSSPNRRRRGVKRVSMELGGHAPFLVFDDADPVHAAKGAAAVKFLNTGQACICPNRMLVQRGIAERVRRHHGAALQRR